MNFKQIASACVAATLMATPASRVAADAGDVAAGLIIGGLIGGAIVNENNKKKRVTTQRTSSSGMSSATREANREVQTALNYFGFPVGTPDGSIGPKSRNAIGEYQMTLGYASTGQLTDYERNLLLTSYQRAMAGGPVTNQQIAANPMGVRGLLLSYRDEMAGVTTAGAVPVAPAAPANPFVVAPADPATGAAPTMTLAAPVAPAAPEAPFGVAPAAPVLASTGEAALAPVAPVAPEAGAPAAALPNFMGSDPAMMASLVGHCDTVGLKTAANGGVATAATISDPAQALGEQFCLARSFAISDGDQLAASIQGFTPQQIADQCAGFGPALAGQVAMLSSTPASEVIPAVSTFIAGTGMSPAQLAGTARICLSVGYRADKLDVAMGSALLLTAIGEGVYGELIGHHLSQGIAVDARPDLALGWYDMGLDALSSGSTAVFAPAQVDRADLIRKAAYTLGGKSDQAQLSAPAVLPDFGLIAPEPAPLTATTTEVALVPDVLVPDALAIDPVSDGTATDAMALLPAPTDLAPMVTAEETAPAAADIVVVADAASATVATDAAPAVDALPMVMRLPFLLFDN